MTYCKFKIYNSVDNTDLYCMYIQCPQKCNQMFFVGLNNCFVLYVSHVTDWCYITVAGLHQNYER